jgi:hypothetical protein
MVAHITASKPIGGYRFFLLMAAFAVILTVGGFFHRFLLPLLEGRFHGPPVIYLHASLFFGWVMLLLTQAALAATGRMSLHRRLGWAGAVLALAMTIAGVAVALYACERDLGLGKGEEAKAFLVAPLLDMVLFPSLVGVAILNRHCPDTHKRLMLLATIVLLVAPMGRLMLLMVPLVQNVVLTATIATDVLIVVAIAYDLAVRGRIHPAYIWGGAWVVAVHVAQRTLGETAAWMSIANRIAALLT